MQKMSYSGGMNRRTLIGGAVALATQAQPKQPTYAYVGCYTTPQRRGRGDGIHVYRMDPESGGWSHVQRVGDLMNPSFLILSRDQRFLYSVHGDGDYATSFAVDKSSGQLTPLNQGKTGGTNGVHQAIDRSGKFMVVANYGSGTVAVLPVRQDGALGDFVQLVELRGKPGPHRVEQNSSHPHHVVFDPTGRFVLIPDKGFDCVHVFRFDPASGKLSPTEQGAIIARAGSAPRHLAFHPTLPVAWVINELGNSVTTYQWRVEDGSLRAVQVLPSLPPDFTGDSTGAEITSSADGRFVYCSNRGHDSVAMFAVDPKTGTLRSTGWAPSLGKTPRYIALDPRQRFLYVTNEQGDTVVPFRVDRKTGHLTPAGAIPTGSPVTIAFSSAI